MADNVPITAGTGTNIATDDVGGVHYQVIKNAFGALDTATLVSATNPMPVVILTNGVVSTANSSSANLAASAIFTGTSEDLTEYSNIAISIFASHASATDGLSIQQSSDGTNWDLLDVFSIPAATGKNFTFGVHAKFYRLVYTNGGTLTTSLRIQTMFFKNPKKSSSQRPQDARTNDNDFEEVLSYLVGYNGTSWDRLRAKAASTAAVAGDISLVVALSPNSPVAQATLTKGTQGATGVTSQDLKDAGRSARTITLDSFAVAATAETIMTMSYSTDNATLTTGTSYAVTTGKRLRIQSITLALHVISGNTTATSIIVRIRAVASGSAIVTSPVQAIFVLPGQTTQNLGNTINIPFPDGWEFPAGAGIAVTEACAGFVATTAAPKLDVAIVGYEY